MFYTLLPLLASNSEMFPGSPVMLIIMTPISNELFSFLTSRFMSTSYPTTAQGGYDSPYHGSEGPPPKPQSALPLHVQPPPPPPPPPPPQPPVEEPKPETVLIEDLLKTPGRKSRPKKVVIILRGPPGSGKTYVAKLIKVTSLFKFLQYPLLKYRI